MRATFFECSETMRPAHLLCAAVMLLTALCNLHLLRGTEPSPLIFTLDGIRQGEWYRLITHPLVHVSGYHLILDGLCMCLLFRAADLPIFRKLGATAICGVTSLVYAVSASPHIATTGYCGLSGIAHGFMFLVGWQWFFAGFCASRSGRNAQTPLGILFCLVVLAKSLWEVHTGQVLFRGSHYGDLGTPIVHAHLGGVFGGFISALLMGKAGAVRWP